MNKSKYITFSWARRGLAEVEEQTMRMEYREQRQKKIHTENMKKIGQEQQKISPKIGLDFK